MEVVEQIAGRETLPVWALPYVTSWRLSPDMLLDRLVKPDYDSPAFPVAFTLDKNNYPA